MRKSKNSSRSQIDALVSSGKTKVKEIPLGSEYDLTLNLNEEFILTAVHALDLNAVDRKSYALATSRSKTSTSKLSARSGSSTARKAETKLNLTDALLEGVPDPTVHKVGVVTLQTTTPRALTSQAPVKLSRFDSRLSLTDARPKTSRTIRPDFPNGHVHNYVFGFENPEPYIPHPFVSSHKPKTNRPRTQSARRIQDMPEVRIRSSAKLSSRRQVPVKQGKLKNSIILDGNFENFMNDMK